MTPRDVNKRIKGAFADAGCVGWLHARRITAADTADIDIDIAADDHVVMASVYKVALAVALGRAFAAGTLDPATRIEVIPGDLTPGPTGLSLLCDPLVTSLRDLTISMLTASDNAAADILLDAVGLDAVTDVLDDLGLDRTRIMGGTSEIHSRLRIDMDVHTTREAFEALSSPDTDIDIAAYDPALTSATTARDMTSLLNSIWTGVAVPSPWDLFIRESMSKQIWPNRIRAGFPHRGVTVAGKTGTIGIIRNEIAVIEYPGEVPVAVAVFTRAARVDPILPTVDAVIGTVARMAVTELRSGRLD